MKCVPIVSIAIFTNNYFKPMQNNYEFIYSVQEVDVKFFELIMKYIIKAAVQWWIQNRDRLRNPLIAYWTDVAK